MFYEVFIPSAESEGFDVTMTVEADNWMQALKTGLTRTGEGEDAIRNVMCDIKDDNSIHVTDATTRRVFVLKEMGEEGAEAPGQTVDPEEEFATIRMEAPDFANPPSSSEATTSPGSAASTKPGERIPTAPGIQQQVDTQSEDRQRAEEQKKRQEEERQRQEAERQRQEAERQRREAEEAERQRQEAERQREEQARIEAEEAARKKAEDQAQRVAAQDQESAVPPSDSFEGQRVKDSEEAWRRIGSSTYEALRKDSGEAKVVREERVPTGQRRAVEIGRGDESVSENILEEVFLEINRIHEGEMAMEEVVNYVMDMAMEKIRAEAGSIMFADVNGKELYFATARGPKAHEVMNFRVPMGVGVVGFCAREGVSLAISDAERDPRFYKDISDALGYETRSLCCAPVQFEGRVYGAIELLNKDTQNFSSTEVNVLTYIGRQLAKYVHDLIMAREKLE